MALILVLIEHFLGPFVLKPNLYIFISIFKNKWFQF